MHKAHVLLFVLVGFLVVCCDAFDPDGNGKPTSFNGKILFSDTNEPVRGEIWMDGIKDDFPGDRHIIQKTSEIDAEGFFDFNFEGDKDIDFFVITIVAQSEDPFENPVKSYECIGFNCDRISPGSNCDNYMIKAERN